MISRFERPWALIFAAFTIAGLASVSPALAQEDRDAQARIHFEAGASYYAAGEFERAAEEFERAHALSGRVELLHNVYLSRRDLGDDRGAAEALRRYLEGSHDLSPERRAHLEHRLAALERSVAAAEEPTEPSPAPETPRADPSPVESERPGLGPVPGAVVLGGGGAGLAVSLVQGIRARKTRDEYDALCDLSGLPDRCRPEDASALDSLVADFERQRSSAWGLLAGGVVTAGVGTVLLLVGGANDDSDETASADVACGATGCTLRIFGSF